MSFVLKTKKQIILVLIILELFMAFVMRSQMDIADEDFMAWFTGIQFVIVASLFMPEGRHGVGRAPRVSDYQDSKRQWAAMSEDDKRRVTRESRHDMMIGFLYIFMVGLSLFFVMYIWIPIIFPLLSKPLA